MPSWRLHFSYPSRRPWSFLPGACARAPTPWLPLSRPPLFPFFSSPRSLSQVYASCPAPPSACAFFFLKLGQARRRRKDRFHIFFFFCPSSTCRHLVNDEAPSQWGWEICRRELPFHGINSIAGVGEGSHFNKFIHEHSGGNEVFSLYIVLNINQFILCIEHKFANREKLDTEYSIHLSV